MDNIVSRLKKYLDFKGIPVGTAEKKVGISNSSLSKPFNNKTSIKTETLESFLNAYRDINAEWLLFGFGEMLKDDEEIDMVNETREHYNAKEEADAGIPLIDIDAMAGYGKGDNQIMQYDNLNEYRIPELEGRGVKYLIRVSGSSMYPKYSNGDLLACRPLKDKTFFQWGKPYVLDTEQGAIVKRLFQCPDDDDCLECHSDNKQHYPPFKIPKDSIRALSIVVGVIRLE